MGPEAAVESEVLASASLDGLRGPGSGGYAISIARPRDCDNHGRVLMSMGDVRVVKMS